MSEIINDPAARSKVESDILRLCATLADDTEITTDDLKWHRDFRDSGITTERYSDGRSKADVATKLGITATQLSKALHGQDILDIGCGRGVFASDVAKDKSIHVTALDSDSSVLDWVPQRPNITAVEGSGYDLAASGLERNSFDSVFVTYSTNFWASTLEEVEKSISEPLKVLKPGGSVYFTPVAQNLGLRDAELNGFMRPLVDEQAYYKYCKVYGLFAIKAYGLINELETAGEVKTAIRASHKNARVTKKPLGDGRLISPDSFSAILTHCQ